MSSISLQPDFESHHKVKLNHQQIQISFRYFSPDHHHKIRTSLSPQQSQNGSKRKTQKQKQIVEQQNKVERDPFVVSKKFYEHNLNQVRDSALENYQNFEKKLMLMGKQSHKKNLRLRITLKQKKDKVQQIDRYRDSYVKKVKINLKNKQQGEYPFKELSNHKRYPQSFIQSPSLKQKSFLTPKQKQNTQAKNGTSNKNLNSHLIKIKLFEDQNTQNRQLHSDVKRNGFETPNRKNSSSKRGISVCSSASSQNKSKNRSLSKTFNTSFLVRSSMISKKSLQTLPNQNQSIRQTVIKLHGTNQKERKTESFQRNQTKDFLSPPKTSKKSRIYSKQRIQRKMSPIKETTKGLIKK